MTVTMVEKALNGTRNEKLHRKLDKKHWMQRFVYVRIQRFMSGFRGLCWYAREYVVILAIFATYIV
jgi:hypothetical protein